MKQNLHIIIVSLDKKDLHKARTRSMTTSSFRKTHFDNLVYQGRSSEDGPSGVSERWCSTQRRGSHTEDGATSSGSSLLSGVPPWLSTALHTALQAAHPCYNCSIASQKVRRIYPPPTPPTSLASSLDTAVSSSGIE